MVLIWPYLRFSENFQCLRYKSIAAAIATIKNFEDTKGTERKDHGQQKSNERQTSYKQHYTENDVVHLKTIK